eukprot:TRINITY_DN6635_c0_g1_i1.p1 TRINITY_DN6635_c0_g1~~TRINITY_DN6635_c0_g1_i1.p1  ORF type:complete len:1147 (-),score=365.23 TRINITY_DN6635_c0_g1_i1:13-3453(-)
MSTEEVIDLCSSQEDNFDYAADQLESPSKKPRIEVDAIPNENHKASMPSISPQTNSYSSLQDTFEPPRKVLFKDVTSEQIEGLGGLLGVGMTRDSANPLAYSNLDRAVHEAGLTPSTSLTILSDVDLEAELNKIFANPPKDYERRVNEILEEQEVRKLKQIYDQEKTEGKDTVEHIYSNSHIVTGSILPTKGSPSPQKDKQKSASPSSSSVEQSPQTSPYKSPLSTKQNVQNFNTNTHSNKSEVLPRLESIHNNNSKSNPSTPLKSYKNNESSFTFTSPLKSTNPNSNSNSAPNTPSKTSPNKERASPLTPRAKDPTAFEEYRKEMKERINNKPTLFAQVPVPGLHRRTFDDNVRNEANKKLYEELKMRKESHSRYNSSSDNGPSHWENALWSYMKKVKEHEHPIVTFEQAAALTGGTKTRSVLKEIFGMREGNKWAERRIKSMQEFWDGLPKENLPLPKEIHARLPPNWGPGKPGKVFNAEKLLRALNMLQKKKLIQVDDIISRNSQNIKWRINGVILSDKENENRSYQSHINLSEEKYVISSGCQCKGKRNADWCKHSAALLFHLVSAEERDVIIKACAEKLSETLPNLATTISEITQQTFRPPQPSSNSNNNNNNNGSSSPLEGSRISPKMSPNHSMIKSNNTSPSPTPLNVSPIGSPSQSRGNSPLSQSTNLTPRLNKQSIGETIDISRENSQKQNEIVRLDLDDEEPSYPSLPRGSPLVQKEEATLEEVKMEENNSIFDLETPPCSQNSPPTAFITEEHARDSFANALLNSMDSVPSNSLGTSQNSLGDSMDSREGFLRLEKEKDEEAFPNMAASFSQFEEIMKEPKKIVMDWPPQPSNSPYHFKGNFSLSDEEYIQLGLHLFNPIAFSIPESVEYLRECLQWGYTKLNPTESMKPEIVVIDRRSSTFPKFRIVVPKGRKGQAIAWLKRLLSHSSSIADIEKEGRSRCIGIDEESIARYHHMQFVSDSEIIKTVKGVIGKDYSLKLILDSSEHKKKEWAAEFQKNFRNFGESLSVETRQMKFGDYAWLIQYPLHGTDHYQLELIVERKSSTDLKSTLGDCRSFTQPKALGKLKDDGIDVIYIIEGSIANTGFEPTYREFEKKLSDLGFKVSQSCGEVDTIHRLSTITDKLWQKMRSLIKKQ